MGCVMDGIFHFSKRGHINFWRKQAYLFENNYSKASVLPLTDILTMFASLCLDAIM